MSPRSNRRSRPTKFKKINGHAPAGTSGKSLIMFDLRRLRWLCADEQLDRLAIRNGVARREPDMIRDVEFHKTIQQNLDCFGVVTSAAIDIDAHCTNITEYPGYLRTPCVPIPRLEDIHDLVGIVVCLDIIGNAG